MTDAATLTVGATYTMSIEKHPAGDRSWSHDLWTILAQNETHVVIQNAAPRYRGSFGAKPMVVERRMFDWAPADDLLAAVAEHARNPA